MSGASNISCSCSMSSVMRSTSMFPTISTSGDEVKRDGLIDPHPASPYHFRQWQHLPNPLGRRFPITASSARLAVGEWVLFTKPKTSSSVAMSR
jgi:hypothetical protein